MKPAESQSFPQAINFLSVLYRRAEFVFHHVVPTQV